MAVRRILVVLLLSFALGLSRAMEFRTITGAKNTAGSSGTPGYPLLRLVPTAYQDGASEPRGGGLSTPLKLPGPRSISNKVLKQTGNILEPAGLSNVFWTWGQFIDHDLDLSGETDSHFDIAIPKGDKTFGSLSKLPFKRSGFVSGSPRQQKNDITAFMDASQVYGSQTQQAKNLRESGGNGCRLITSPGNLLKFEGGEFIAGDIRVGEQPGLTAMHTIFLREHNRLADQLLAQNPSMNNETCYQVARLLVGVEMQIITLNEFLPKLLGSNAMNGLKKSDKGKKFGIFNEFSTVCFRFGHSMVTDGLDIRNNKYCKTETVPLEDAFFNPNLFKDKGLDAIVRGLVSQQAQRLDASIVPALRNSLFEGLPGSFQGLDLASLNIQRGRDHGIPGICGFRKALGITPFRNLKHRQLTSDRRLARRLKRAYGKKACRVDPWVAALSENRKPGSIVGPTCHKVIETQFRMLFERDRFSFLHMKWKQYGLKFNPKLAPGVRLSKVTLGKIIALNTDLKELKNKDVFRASQAPRPSGC